MYRHQKIEKGGINMKEGYKKLDRNILQNKKRRIISSNEALKDIVPIKWSDDVINGRKKVTIGR